MFSAILGLVGAGISAAVTAGQAADARAFKEAELRNTKEQQVFNQWMSQQALDMTKEDNAYQREMEALNRLLAEQERAWSIEQYMLNSNIMSDERQYQVDRQIEMDQEAARIKALQLEQLLQNQDIAASERAYAVQQLEEAKAIASGERADDLRRYYQEQATAQAERDFVLNQFYDARAGLYEDRNRDLALTETLMTRASTMQSEIDAALAKLGDVPDLQRLTKQDLDNEITRRQDAYMSDVDRAATRIGSVNEANLIRAGLDASTPGTSRRGEITREIADAYQSARDRAYDDALKYITGQQDFFNTDYASQMQRRSDVIGEVLGTNQADLNILMNLPNVTSTDALMEMTRSLPTANWTRDIKSANSYGAPVAIGSAIYDALNVNPGMSNYQVTSSAANPNYAATPSAIFNPYSQTLMDPAQYATIAANLATGMLSQRSADYTNAQARADDALGSFLSGAADFAQNNLDPLWGSWNTSASGVSSAGMP